VLCGSSVTAETCLISSIHSNSNGSNRCMPSINSSLIQSTNKFPPVNLFKDDYRYCHTICCRNNNKIHTCTYTPCLKKTSHLWLAVTFTHMNGFWYFLAEMLRIKSAIKRRFNMPPQATCASALPGKMRKHENHTFHSIGLCYTHNAPVCYLPER